MITKNDLTRVVTVAALTLSGARLLALEGPAMPTADQLPQVPDGFRISVFAAEPLFYKPTALCFDAKGRLMLGQGPQYHLSESIKETDSVVFLLDTDGDGAADRRKVFATGFNSIQGLAWKGNDLYVANSPELTVVRDLDGDDVADEYVIVYTDLGNHEHALHGLVWGPDGRLYMSKGNSKGHNQPAKYGRVAPKAFRELWDVEHPSGVPDIPPRQTFTAESYRSTYHDPHDDWGRQGGVLRCEPLGDGLEIVSRGMRNPWDIALDNAFNILATDNDQTQGDRIIRPFLGAHFGWGHLYSSHWTGTDNLPTVPVSGPMTSGSWAGIIHYDHPSFPANYRDAFFINDWLFGTFVFRAGWKGALRSSADGALEPFIQRREGGMIYRPTDLAMGPEGAIYTLGWGGNYHYQPGQEGSWIFRVTSDQADATEESSKDDISRRTTAQLIAALGPETLPARRVNAQDELVRRGAGGTDELVAAIASGSLSPGQQTWAVWTLGRIADPGPAALTAIRKWARPTVKNDETNNGATSPSVRRTPRDLRIQSIRILADRHRRSLDQDGERHLFDVTRSALSDADPRLRFEAFQASHQASLKRAIPDVIHQLERESDGIAFYAGWQAIRHLSSPADRRNLLDHSSNRVRLAGLLGLQEDFLVNQDDVLRLVGRETDATVQSWALTFAMNPRRPAKLSNDTLRIEMEQTFPVASVIERTTQANRPELRRLYLQVLSRASVREGEQQRQLLDFYRTLVADEEREILLPSIATTMDAFPDLWNAMGGPRPLQDAAVTGIGNLLRLHVRQLRSDEESVESTEPSVARVGKFAVEIARRILAQLSDSDDSRVLPALQALNDLPLPDDWSPSKDGVSVLLDVLAERDDPSTLRTALRIVAKIPPKSLPQRRRLHTAIEHLCRKPNPRLFGDLKAVVAAHNVSTNVPAPPAATPGEVLSLLSAADPERGRKAFFDRVGGAGCMSCHRVRGQGSDVAPDLSGVGRRLTPQNMIQAIITPSANVTEGYALHVFVLEDGRQQTGAVLRETAREVTILTSDGRRRVIATNQIEVRRRLKESVMPTGYAQLGAEQLADLTAWLLTLRDGPTR